MGSCHACSKVSRNILFAKFGLIDLKLCQIYSNDSFEIWINLDLLHWKLTVPKDSTSPELFKNIKFAKFGQTV